MKQKYYLIVENVVEVIEFGEFESLLEANRFLDNNPEDEREHYTHAHPSIVISHNMIEHLIKQLSDQLT